MPDGHCLGSSIPYTMDMKECSTLTLPWEEVATRVCKNVKSITHLDLTHVQQAQILNRARMQATSLTAVLHTQPDRKTTALSPSPAYCFRRSSMRSIWRGLSFSGFLGWGNGACSTKRGDNVT